MKKKEIMGREEELKDGRRRGIEGEGEGQGATGELAL